MKNDIKGNSVGNIQCNMNIGAEEKIYIEYFLLFKFCDIIYILV